METLNTIICTLALLGFGFFGLGIMAGTVLLLRAKAAKVEMETLAIKRKLNG